MTRIGRGWWKAAVLGLGLWGAAGCANRNANGYDSAAYPDPPPRTVIAEPGAYDEIYVRQVVEQPADDGVVGYETLSDGTTTTVVTYVHTYPEPIESYPSVYWSGRWYYNINGDFVYYNDEFGMWAYYWGPPAPLVACWNGYYPYSPYYWGVGYYGAGWYWGGVGVYGYHAYGLPVVHEHHHHHYDYDPQSPSSGSSGGSSRPNPGKPTDSPNTGGPATDDGPRRTKVADAGNDGPTRDKPPQASPSDPTRTPVADAGGGAVDPGRDRPGADASAGDPARKLPGGDDTVAPARTQPGRDAAPTRDAGSDTTLAQAQPRRDPIPKRSSYTTAGGQRITVIDPPSRPSRTRTPTTFEHKPDTSFRVPSREPTRAPSWGQPTARPSRDAATAPTRTSADPSFGTPSRSPAPSRATPTRPSPTPTWGAPSRSPSPSRATPSRTSPSRSPGYSPSRSPSPSRATPSRTSPSRSPSFSPSRTSPSRSPSYSPSRTSPSRTSPSRSPSFSPSRSSPSPSRSAPSRTPSHMPSRRGR